MPDPCTPEYTSDVWPACFASVAEEEPVCVIPGSAAFDFSTSMKLCYSLIVDTSLFTSVPWWLRNPCSAGWARHAREEKWSTKVKQRVKLRCQQCTPMLMLRLRMKIAYTNVDAHVFWSLQRARPHREGTSRVISLEAYLKKYVQKPGRLCGQKFDATIAVTVPA